MGSAQTGFERYYYGRVNVRKGTFQISPDHHHTSGYKG